jgi:hypothetical protein
MATRFDFRLGPAAPGNITRRQTCPRSNWTPALLRLAKLAGVCSSICLTAGSAPAQAVPMPDHRGYELVSPGAGNDGNVLNGATPFLVNASKHGNAVDWEALGTCCGAESGSVNVYQASRLSTGWATHAISPTPPEPITGIENLQEAVFTSDDLTRTIFTTPASYAEGNRRPHGAGASDLYLREPGGELEWLSQGPLGTGTGPHGSHFAGATPTASIVAFESAEALTAGSQGLAEQPWSQYLYVRNIAQQATSLVNVNNEGALISPYGATLGDAGPPAEGLFFFGYRGSTINSLSESGATAFFESPPSGVELPAGAEPHLYLRNLSSQTTTAMDDPNSSGSARYEGASADGTLVFFTSDEGLSGASNANELYEFNTTGHPIGGVPANAPTPLASGGGVVGVISVSNDGSHVFFVASDVLSSHPNAAGKTPGAGQPNLYVRDTRNGETTFVATLAPPDVTTCNPTCGASVPTGLVGSADVSRPAYSGPDGTVFVFTSSGDLTGESQTPTTMLSSSVAAGEHKLQVGSTEGFLVGHTIAIDSGAQEELETVESVDGPTELTVSEYGPALVNGLTNEHPAGAGVSGVNAEVYRYSATDDSLTCLSCTQPGVLETSGASLGEVAGGSYAPSGHVAQMSEDGTRIFFQSPDPLLPGMPGAVTNKTFPPTNLYEWDAGRVYLISEAVNGGSTFDGTTPSGDDAFFSTRAPLTPEAVPGYQHIFDARVDGGFTRESSVKSPCAQEPCRNLAVPPSSSPVPASESSSGAEPPLVTELPERFVVHPLTQKQRRRAARSGILPLTVSVGAAGTIRAVVTYVLHGKALRVAHDSASSRGRGTLLLVLRLRPVVRSRLKSGRRVSLHLSVSFTGTRKVYTTVVRLSGMNPQL